MKRPQLVSQGSITRMMQAAMEAEGRRDFAQCIEILERASRLAPANHRILLDLGGLYGRRYDYAAAERCLEKAARVSPNPAETLAGAGEKCRQFGRFEMAQRFLQRAAEHKHVTSEILVKLAEIFERRRRLDDAASAIDRALALNGACASALLARARLERQTGRLESAERLLRSALATADKESRLRAWYELGGVLDRQKRYDEAMSAFREAKAVVQADAPPHAARLKNTRARLAELRESLTSDLLADWFELGRTLQPQRRLALLCGHPRSGTTLLEQVLDSHPEIVSAEETEIFYDDAYYPLIRGFPENTPLITSLASAQTSALAQSRENYFQSVERFLGQRPGHRLLVDKNPSLTFLIPMVIRIFPETRFLVALRDPRDVCLSCFMQPFFPIGMTSSAYLSLEGTVQEYTALMGMWTALAPKIKNPFLQVRYEDMVNDLEPVARRTLDFLGITWDERVLQFDKHARQKIIRSPTYADVTKPVFKTAVGRWRNYQKYFEPHLEKLAPFAKAFGYD